jgi:cell division protein FtsQ
MENNKEAITDSLLSKYLKLLLLFLFLPFILFIFNEYIIPQYFSNSSPKIVIQGSKRLKKEDLYSFLKGKVNKNIANISPSDIEHRLEEHLRIKKASVSRKTGNKLEIKIDERQAEFIINSGDTLYEVDSDFRIISIDDVREENLCILTGEFSPQDGVFSGAVVREFASTVNRAFKIYPQLKSRISEVELRNDGSVMAYIHYPSHIRANAGLSLESQQVRKLYAALAFFENKNIKPKTLDLRGDDAVYQ